MKKLGLAIIGLILLTSCVTANPQPIVTVVKATPAPQQLVEPLTLDDVATILTIAIKDLRDQGYEPLFLNEMRGYIWVRATDGAIKLYTLDTLIKAYQDGKRKPAETN